MILAAASGRALWYLTRSSGIVALVLLTAVMVLGVVATAGWHSRLWPRFVSQGLHKNLTLVALVVMALHIVSAVADGFAPIGFVDAVVPLHSPYRPVWLGLGAISFDLLVAVTLTSMLRRHIGYRIWKVVHWTSYAMWPLAVLHGLGTGTDTRLDPVLMLNGVCALAVALAVAWRLTVGWPQRALERLLVGGAAVVALAAIGAFVVVGPLKPGWALRAGTPVALLEKIGAGRVALASPGGSPSAGSGGSGGSASAGAGTASQPAQAGSTVLGGALPTAPFRADFSGTLTQSSPDSDGNATVGIVGQLSGGAGGELSIQLVGPPIPGGGLSVVSSTVSYDGANGQVVQLNGGSLVATVSDQTGATLVLSVRLQIDQATGSVAGLVVGGPPSSFGGGGDR